MLSITVEVKGDKQVQRKLRALGQSVNDLSYAMDRIGDEAARYFSGPAWDSQGGVFGEKWPALSPITLIARGHNVVARNKGDAQFGGFLLNRRMQSGGGGLIGSSSILPLVDSGEMRDSFTYKAGKQQVVISNKKDYFKYHQSSKPRQRIPRRRMIGINNSVKGIVRAAIQDDIRRKIKRT